MKYLVATAALLVACVPAFVEEPWLVTKARVLAVKSEPAEGPPGAPRMLHALIAEVAESDTSLEPQWNLCSAPKPVTENNAVATDCLEPQHLLTPQLGRSVTLTALADACIRFGPDTSGMGYRPRPPDATGGYYQPIRLDVPGADPAFHLARLSCRLAEAPLALVTEFAKRYAVNLNPTLLSLTINVNGRDVQMSELQAGDTATLTAGWSAESAETYAYFDRRQQAVVENREVLRVDWYVAAGSLETSTTLLDTDATVTQANNRWTLPAEATRVSLWAVLRDSRGGSDFLIRSQ